MTKKEFIKRMNEIKELNLDRDFTYTCNFVSFKLGKKAYLKYKQIIKPYIGRYNDSIDYKFKDIFNSRGTVRILALTTFEIECLESGIYEEF